MQAAPTASRRELDGARDAVAKADAEAQQIRTALGDIGAERSRLLAEADAQAEALLADGRARLEAEVADLHTKADADIAAVASRGSDELRAEIARLASLTADRVVAETLDDETQQRLIEDFISACRSRSEPMSTNDARIDGYARGLFEVAKAEGTLDEVEDELFRFARSYEASDELRNTLTDDEIPPAKRQAIVEDLLGGKATPTTVQLISMVVGSGHGRDLPAIVDRMVQRAAESKDREVAEVRSAVELDRRPDRTPRRRARQRHRQERQPQGRRRPLGARRPRRHRRRHRHRRHRPHPPRPAEVPPVGTKKGPWPN